MFQVGEQGGSYLTYHFGFGVENTSPGPVRVSFKIDKVDAEDYITENYYVTDDIDPGEKKLIY